MKKIIAMLITLFFVLSTFGVVSTLAQVSARAAPETVRVGQLIVVTTDATDPCPNETCYDPTIKIYDPLMESLHVIIDDSEFEEFRDASFYVTKISGPTHVLIEDSIPPDTWVWVYRANFPGTIVFGVPFWQNYFSPPNARVLSNPVTINKRSLPMREFMRILGIGGLMRE